MGNYMCEQQCCGASYKSIRARRIHKVLQHKSEKLSNLSNPPDEILPNSTRTRKHLSSIPQTLGGGVRRLALDHLVLNIFGEQKVGNLNADNQFSCLPCSHSRLCEELGVTYDFLDHDPLPKPISDYETKNYLDIENEIVDTFLSLCESIEDIHSKNIFEIIFKAGEVALNRLQDCRCIENLRGWETYYIGEIEQIRTQSRRDCPCRHVIYNLSTRPTEFIGEPGKKNFQGPLYPASPSDFTCTRTMEWKQWQFSVQSSRKTYKDVW